MPSTDTGSLSSAVASNCSETKLEYSAVAEVGGGGAGGGGGGAVAPG